MLNRDRLQQAQARMRERGIDAYLILTHDDYIYFFGEDRFQPRAVIPAAGPPIVVTFQGEEAEVRESIGVDDVKIFGTVGQQIKDVVGAMRDMAGGREYMTVGVQMWFNTPAFLLNLFQRANPKIKVVDELRLVKDAEEVRLIREAARIAAVGMKTAAAWLRPGISENEVGAEIEYAMRKAGGQGVATPVFVNSGVRSGWLHGTASDKQVEAGELVVVDVVPRFQGYCANLTRTFVVGSASAKQQELFDVYRRAQAAGVSTAKPGAKNGDIDAAAPKGLRRRRLWRLLRPWHQPQHRIGFRGNSASHHPSRRLQFQAAQRDDPYRRPFRPFRPGSGRRPTGRHLPPQGWPTAIADGLQFGLWASHKPLGVKTPRTRKWWLPTSLPKQGIGP